MKKIAEIENAMKNETVKDLNISYNFYWAYIETKERKNKYLNISTGIWSKDIDAIFADLKRYGIKTFTISNSSTILMEDLAAFCERGCKVTGMVKINGRESMNDKFEIIVEQENAIKLQITR